MITETSQGPPNLTPWADSPIREAERFTELQWGEISLYHLYQCLDLPPTHTEHANYLEVSHA